MVKISRRLFYIYWNWYYLWVELSGWMGSVSHGLGADLSLPPCLSVTNPSSCHIRGNEMNCVGTSEYMAKVFARAIGFARWPNFQIVSFLEYLVFFRALFATEQLKCSWRIVFCLFLAFLNFDPNWPFCKFYSLCRMADFQNCLISLIFGVF